MYHFCSSFESLQQGSQMYGSSRGSSPSHVEHRGQYGISTHTQILCSICARPRTFPSKEGKSSSDGSRHTILLCVVDRQHLHSKVDICCAHTSGQLHGHIHTKMNSDPPSFVTPAYLALSITVLWVAFVTHVSVNSTTLW